VASEIADEIEFTLFLVGDGGAPDPEGEPVLEALESQIVSTAAPSTVIFLGDNIYQRGMPPESADNRKEMERRIRAQMDAVLGTGAGGIFISGNHDWDRSGKDGWNAVRRQEEYIEGSVEYKKASQESPSEALSQHTMPSFFIVK
jgi:hypothetical protein